LVDLLGLKQPGVATGASEPVTSVGPRHRLFPFMGGNATQRSRLTR
jgi:hypothetical protein